MAYSTACNTPLSNFEAGLNYKDVSDPSVVIHFPLVDTPEVSMVAWTTTPWTLPSNLALCINPEYDYVKIRDLGKVPAVKPNESKVWLFCYDITTYHTSSKTTLCLFLSNVMSALTMCVIYRSSVTLAKPRDK